MKSQDQQLREALQALSTPASAGAPAAAWERARNAWRESQAAKSVIKKAPRVNPIYIWTMTAAAAGVAIVAIFMVQRPPPVPQGSGHLLAEMENLFPGQVLAVVRQDQAVDLQLGAGSAPIPTDQALRLELVRGRQRVEVLTYSGRSVGIKLAGQLLQLTPLLTNNGDLIILTGDNVVAPGGQLAGFEVSGQRLMENQS